MKFKRGDKVKIRKDLKLGVIYNDCGFVGGMEEYRGKTATVLELMRDDWYKLDIDDYGWTWSDEMLEPVEFTKDDLRPGDIITTRHGKRFNVGEDGYINGSYSSNDKLLNDDLTNGGGMGRHLDIVKVERPQVIWRRERTNEELHREMWNWLAENPEKQKGDWLDKEDIDVRNECFACKECNGDCEKCPLDKKVIGCNKPDGLYTIWRGSEDVCVRNALAKVIAGLPWKSVE